MDNQTPKRKFLNLFDIIIIAIVVIAAVAFLAYGYFSSKTANADDASDSQSGRVEYIIELTSMPEQAANSIKAGDVLIDSAKKYELGTVQSVEVTDMEKLTADYDNGRYIISTVPDRYTATIVLSSACEETDSSIVVGGGFKVAGGTAVGVKGPGYGGSGYILQVERSAD